MTNIAIDNCHWAIEIVSFPIKTGGSFHSYVNVYQSITIWLVTMVDLSIVFC